METLLIYYNPNSESFYIKFNATFLLHDLRVGYTNSYDHLLCQIFYPRDGHFIECLSFWELTAKTKKPTLKNRLINGIIRLLNKIKD